jgi:hypothetical protein
VLGGRVENILLNGYCLGKKSRFFWVAILILPFWRKMKHFSPKKVRAYGQVNLILSK